MDFGPYKIAVADVAGNMIGLIPRGPDGRVWDTLEKARTHLGVQLPRGHARFFILDRDGEDIEEIEGDGPLEVMAHEAYHAYMQPERAEREKARLARLERARIIREIENTYRAS